jgi:hypothetical protein
MSAHQLCKICGVRRARRACPGLGSSGSTELICPTCCGEGREETISCPLDCEYLREARLHEQHRDTEHQHSPKETRHADIEVTEDFLRRHEEVIAFLGMALAQAGLETAGAVDTDLVSALDAMIRTHRTLHTGLVYETRAEDRVAADVQVHIERSIAEWQHARSEKQGLSELRPAEILGVLVFLARLATRFENGRKRGRRYLDYLRVQFSVPIPEAAPSRLIL